MTDPNWFFSTSAQSTAALVAIIGGFLLSRLVATLGERSAVQKNLYALEVELTISDKDWALYSNGVFERGYRWFVEQNLESAISSNGTTPLGDDLWLPLGSSEKDGALMLERLNRAVVEARTAIETLFPGDIEVPCNVEELTESGLIIPKEQNDIYVAVAIHLGLEREAQKSSNLHLIRNYPKVYPITSDRHIERQERDIRKRDELQSERLGLAAQVRLLEIQLSNLSKPREFVPGFCVLATFGLIGMVYPLTLMTFQPVPDQWYWRLSVLAEFTIGFLSLLGYFLYSILQLGHKDGTAKSQTKKKEPSDKAQNE